MSLAIRAALLAAILCSAATVAADETTKLDKVEVTATRSAQSLGAALEPIVVIDHATIERSVAADLTDLLRFYAGVEIGRSGGPGQTSSAFLRGTESNHVLVLVDGVELNPGTIGGAPFAAVPLASIDHVEIVFGPRSTLYGSEAIGGVIDIVTRSGGARAPLDAELAAGRYATRSAHLGGGASAGAFDGGFDLERFSTSGFPTQPVVPVARGDDRDSLGGSLGWQAGEWQARLRHWQSEGRQEYDDFTLAPVSQSFSDSVSSLTLVQDTSGSRSQLIVAHYEDELVQDQPNPFTSAMDFVRTRRDTLDLQHDLGLGAHDLTLGAYWSGERSAAESFGAYQESTRVLAVYAQDRVSFGANDLAFGARRTDHSTAGMHTSWSAEYGYRFTSALRATLTAGSGFRAPDSTDRYSSCCGNPTLRPELARDREAALVWRATERSEWRVGAFAMDVHDLISFGPSFVLDNIAQARIRGVESGYRVAAADWDWELRAIVQRTEDLATGDMLPRRAGRTLTSRSTWRIGHGVELGVDLLATSARKDSSFSSIVLAGYALADLSLRWTLDPHWTLSARLEDALDTVYQTADGYANPRRSLFVGVDWTW